MRSNKKEQSVKRKQKAPIKVIMISHRLIRKTEWSLILSSDDIEA